MLSVVSYPERGEGGRSSYRGNCSPCLISDLIDQFNVKEICDYMCGSGTTEDVAKQKGIISHCYDLNRGFDLMSMDIPERSRFTFWHPPYGDMIIYSGEQYSAEGVQQKFGFDPRKADISRIHDWDEFVRAMNYCMMKQFAALEKGGRIAVLMGDMKRKGRLYSMLADIVKPGQLEQIVIKMQHNCVSDRRSYSNTNFIPIVHEYLMICKKEDNLYIPVRMTMKRDTDIRDLQCSTWKDVVYEVMRSLGGESSLEDIYREVEGHRKTEANPHWRDKVRQTLQMHPGLFRNTSRGVWATCIA